MHKTRESMGKARQDLRVRREVERTQSVAKQCVAVKRVTSQVAQ